MYAILLCVLAISIVIFMVEIGYVAINLKNRLHTYLFLYILCCLVNNVGYTMEMTAKTLEASYTATRLLYLGKINIALVFLLFILEFCKAKVPKWLPRILFILHQLLYGIILTNDWHHLYYSTITFTEEGMFPHNVYGHGPVYYFAMVIPYAYMVLNIWLLVKTYRKLKTSEEKKQMLYLIAAPATALVGTLVFFTGKTQGFDTGNVGLIFSALCMFMALFKYKLISTVDIAKDTLADSLEDGLIAIDGYDNVEYVNDVAKILYPNIEQLKKDEIFFLIQSLQTKNNTGEIIKQGERSYIVKKRDLSQGNIYRGSLFILSDMTDTFRYTEDIEKERDRADEANAAKSQFLSNMSHEIRTPINSILGLDTMILRESKEPVVRKYAKDIQSSGKSLLSLINDILDFSKVESGKMELICDEYQFVDIINDVVNMVSPKISEKGLKFIVDVDENIPSGLYGDEVRIKQVIVNLLTNAIKYTKSGTVTLTASAGINGDNAIVYFSVKDTGIGIKPEDISKLSEEFVRIEEARNKNIEGTGLGMNIVISLLSLMGSKIEVDSVYGRGSTFSFSIVQPIRDAHPIGNISDNLSNDEEVENDYVVPFCIPDCRLLVVDDNSVNRLVFTQLLKKMECQIDEAESGFECLEMIKNTKYDIIFMDHMMPEMDGIETLHRMKKTTNHPNVDTPVIILTANAIIGEKDEYLAAGFDKYLSKPIDPNKLELIVGEFISDGKKKEFVRREVHARVGSVQKDSLQEDSVQEKPVREADAKKVDFPSIDGVDWQGAMAKLVDEDILKCAVEGFAAMASSDLEILQDMYEAVVNANSEEAFKSFRIKIHSMKSNVSTIGAYHVAGLAKYLEYAAKDNDIQTITNLMPTFMKEWNVLKEAIIKEFYLEKENKDNLIPISTDDLVRYLDILQAAMNEYGDERSDAIIEELSTHSYSDGESEIFEKIKIAVLNLDAEGCTELVKDWKQMIK